MVEVNMIAGMGHGTPVGDGLGAAGPFMLDAGISSTREIARFWKIDATRTNGSTRSILKTAIGEGSPSHSSSPIAEKAVVKRPNPSSDDVSTPQPGSARHDIQAVIENALRAAGLMRSR